MKTLLLLTSFFLTACSHSMYSERSLQAKLQSAKVRYDECEKKIKNLEIALAKLEIAKIRDQVAEFDKENPLIHTSFVIEREKLAAIIQNTPVCALEAQGVLDQILALITELSDDERR